MTIKSLLKTRLYGIITAVSMVAFLIVADLNIRTGYVVYATPAKLVCAVAISFFFVFGISAIIEDGIKDRASHKASR